MVVMYIENTIYSICMVCVTGAYLRGICVLLLAVYVILLSNNVSPEVTCAVDRILNSKN